ncbi:hypothetical protein [Agrobacterium sp. ST15.13.015]|uniref:hypothetical protein n=1 Tax=Agrobacterium sp. ST15.13.015 TaxID=3017319 RepID=UPI0022C29530|nr:hypothetical protein [Agrobacterium sp. ST15.13.015]MCZ7502996.1 hypothetical protein [Rhizobium rhizogenes]
MIEQTSRYATPETKYLPHDWQDEVNPDWQTNPSKFIHKTDAGYILKPVEGCDKEDIDFYVRELQYGDVIKFAQYRNYGEFILTIEDNGTLRTNYLLPVEGNLYRVDGDDDRSAGSLDELVSKHDLEPGTHTIDVFWEGPSTSWSFVIEGETAKFVIHWHALYSDGGEGEPWMAYVEGHHDLFALAPTAEKEICDAFGNGSITEILDAAGGAALAHLWLKQTGEFDGQPILDLAEANEDGAFAVTGVRFE